MSRALQRRRLRAGLAVFAALLVVSGVIGWRLAARYRQDWAATQDLVLGLIYFLEEHNGRFPDSEQEFRASSVIETLGDGAIRVLPRAGTRYGDRPHGIPIRDLSPFRIAWGTDLAALRVDENGAVRDAAGRKVELIRWPSSPPSAKGYTLFLLGVSREIRQPTAAAESQPPGVRVREPLQKP